jgi:hypothetical protein
MVKCIDQLAVWDRVLLSMIRGGFSIGWRCGLVSGIFSLGVTTSTVLRNYVQVPILPKVTKKYL